jgi:hypothetical protein
MPLDDAFCIGPPSAYQSEALHVLTSVSGSTDMRAPRLIHVGVTANDGTGDPIRTALQKVNANFVDVFSRLPAISVKDPMFGAVGDGVADDTRAIQAAIDYALNNHISCVVMPVGVYKTSDTIHLGYGWGRGAGGYSNVTLEGASGFSPGAGGSSAPTRIDPTFVDRPVINIQGQQNAGVRRVHIKGAAPMSGGNHYSWGLPQRIDKSNYAPNGAKNDRRAPFCGVCIDGYYGTKPATPYPTPNYPPWFGATGDNSPYGRHQSSNCFVEDCFIERTLIGIMLQPNGDGNGDFMKFRGTRINECLVGVAIGNSQARVTDYQDMTFHGCWTCIDGVSFGSGNGVVSGNMDNLHADYCFQLLRQNGGWQKGIEVTNFYSEVMVRIGENLGSPTNISFSDCFITCHSSDGYVLRTLPIYDGHGSAGRQFIKFVNCKFVGLWGCAHFNCVAHFDGCTWILTGGPRSDLERTAYQRLGFTAIDQFEANPTRAHFLDCNLNGAQYSSYDVASQVARWWSVGAFGFAPVDYTPPGLCRGGMNLPGVVWSGRTFTATPQHPYCKRGDVFRTAAGWCVLESASASKILGVMISHYQLDHDVYSMLTRDSEDDWVVRSDDYMNDRYPALPASSYFPINQFDIATTINNCFWETTTGSPVVKCVDTGGNVQALPSGVTVDTKLLWTDLGGYVYGRGMPFPNGTAVSEVGTTSVKMANNAQIDGFWLISPGIAKVS